MIAKIGVDTAENEPLEVWGKIQFIISFVSLDLELLPGEDVLHEPAAVVRLDPHGGLDLLLVLPLLLTKADIIPEIARWLAI